MGRRLPNIVYLHSHDTGRYIQPYGHQVPTPNIQRLADQGLLFRQAFSAAPICSASRSALLTGRFGHTNGMHGLAHRGFRLDDYDQHLVHTLHASGYWSALVGEQHVSLDPVDIGYDQIVPIDSTHAANVAPAAVTTIAQAAARDQPFFLSVGFFETHRDFFEPTSIRDALYSLPPANLPDTPQTRRDMASFKQSARSLDQGVGSVLNALDQHGLYDDTLVIFTTDHGPPFPGAKATLSDRGLGVLLIVRGPDGFHGGRVSDALVSQLDIFPTICDLVGLPAVEGLHGRSLMPVVRREVGEVNEEIFGEVTFHAAYEPQRAVRTHRYKYVRRFDDTHTTPVLANVDDSPSKELLLHHGWAEREQAREQLYDLVFDPGEAANVVDEPAYAEAAADMRGRLDRWMHETRDPLLDGPFASPPGVAVNLPTQRSADEPTFTADPVTRGLE